ncbi:MAG TPA: hypothetical protein VFJ09_02895 [Nocardioidaceae bacterium]|nr:hypothetical protein [Nocardioidaceae bacterium]
MTLHSYEFRSVEKLVRDVADEVSFVAGNVYVALVAHPSTSQQLVAVRCLRTPALIDDWYDARDELYDVMHTFAIPDQPRPPRHSAVTFVVRRGLCVLGPNEGRWMSAWRYSNHLTNAYDGSVVLVTEHGWYDFMADAAGHTPAIAA